MFNGYLPTTHTGLLQTIQDAIPLSTPALVYQGTNDYIISNGMTREQADAFATVQYLTGVGVEHRPPRASDGDGDYDAVLAFLRGNMGGSGGGGEGSGASGDNNGGNDADGAVSRSSVCVGVAYIAVISAVAFLF